MFLPKTQNLFLLRLLYFGSTTVYVGNKNYLFNNDSSTVLNKFTYIKRDPQRPLTCLACYGLPSVQSHQNFLEKDRIIGAVDALKRELLIA